MPTPLDFLPHQPPLALQIGAVLLLLWLASVFHLTSLWIFVIAFLFLYQADRIYIQKTRRQLRNEEKRSANQRRPLSDLESVQWLNQALEKIWPVFLEDFVSQKLFRPLIPWFLDKYKPWTAKKAVLRHLYLGRNPPLFTAVRTLEKTADDDHLVMDLHMDFLAAEDMNVVLAVQMRRRLGLGIWTTIHISELQIEGKVRVAVRFLKGWPFLSRVRLCFENAPIVQMTARPLSNHGVNVSELPGVAGWMEKMLADVFEQSLVEPNMLVLDVERLVASNETSMTSIPSSVGNWFETQEKAPIAIVYLEMLEASELKPSDLNGLADPFVKGAFATCRFKTKVQKKTLTPIWKEEFKLPIASWDLPTLVILHVYDKDQFRVDNLGYCEVDISKFRGGQRHELWIPLKDIKMGQIHIAIKVVENEANYDDQSLSSSFTSNAMPQVDNYVDEKSPVFDKSEEINTGGFEDAFLSIMRPGQSVAENRQPKQGKPRLYGSLNAQKSDTLGVSSSDEAGEKDRSIRKPRKRRLWHRRFSKSISLGSSQGQKIINPESCGEVLPVDNKGSGEVLAVGNKGTTVRMRVEKPDQNGAQALQGLCEQINLPETPATDQESISVPESPNTKHQMKHVAKNFMKHAGKRAHDLGHALNRKGPGGESVKEMRKMQSGGAPRDIVVSPVEETTKHSEGKTCSLGDGTSKTDISLSAEKSNRCEEKSDVPDDRTPKYNTDISMQN